MSEKKIIFDNKNIKKSIYKNKKLSKVDDIDFDKILVSKKTHKVKKAHLNTSLGIVMVMSLDHYV